LQLACYAHQREDEVSQGDAYRSTGIETHMSSQGMSYLVEGREFERKQLAAAAGQSEWN